MQRILPLPVAITKKKRPSTRRFRTWRTLLSQASVIYGAKSEQKKKQLLFI